MKIAMVGQFPPHVGGVGVHIHTLSKELVKQGHEVYVITYPHKDIEDIEQIKEIVIDDYHFSEDDSNDDHWVFIKNEKMKYIKK